MERLKSVIHKANTLRRFTILTRSEEWLAGSMDRGNSTDAGPLAFSNKSGICLIEGALNSSVPLICFGPNEELMQTKNTALQSMELEQAVPAGDLSHCSFPPVFCAI